MKKSRFTDSQIIDALKRAEAGLTVPELCRQLASQFGDGTSMLCDGLLQAFEFCTDFFAGDSCDFGFQDRCDVCHEGIINGAIGGGRYAVAGLCLVLGICAPTISGAWRVLRRVFP